MATETTYETLEDVRQAFLLWESEGQASEFGRALWKTAESFVGETIGRTFTTKSELATEVYKLLLKEGMLALCLTDDFRRLIIRYHVRAIPTTLAVEAILNDPDMEHVTPFFIFKHSNVCGYENIKVFLVSRVGYLKRGHPRWPAKFESFWHEERAAYVDNIKAIPLTQPIEQLEKLTDHYQALETEYKNANRATDKERFHKCMIRTMAAIHTLTRDPSIRTAQQALTPAETPKALEEPKSDNIIDVSATTTVVESE